MATTVSKIYYQQQQYMKAYRGDTLEYQIPDFTGLTIKNEYAGANTFTITKNGSPNAVTLDYTVDGGITTSSWSSSSGNLSVQIPEGGKLVIKNHGTSNVFSSGNTNFYHLNCSNNFSIVGDISYLLNKNGNVSSFPSYGFYGLFSSSTTLINAKQAKLPSKTLASYAYASAFQNCTNLTGAPEIYATTFTSSTGELQKMFYNCDSLNYIKVHFKTWISVVSDQWTALIANTSGTFVKPSALSNTENSRGNPTPSTSGQRKSYQIPYGWTVQSY